MHQSIVTPTPKPPRIVGILQGNSGENTKILHWFLAPAPGEIPEIYGLYFSQGGGEGGVFCFYFIEYRWNTVILPVPAKRIWCDGDDCSPGGVLPIMAYTGGAPPERGTFFRLQVYKRVGISQAEVYKRVGKSAIYVFKRAFIEKFSNRRTLWLYQFIY